MLGLIYRIGIVGPWSWSLYESMANDKIKI
jgi:hypothetical protein